ncbi:hypothetical protein BCU64_014805 [Vibrio lentus]
MFDNLGGIHVAALSGEQRRPLNLNSMLRDGAMWNESTAKN